MIHILVFGVLAAIMIEAMLPSIKQLIQNINRKALQKEWHKLNRDRLTQLSTSLEQSGTPYDLSCPGGAWQIKIRDYTLSPLDDLIHLTFPIDDSFPKLCILDGNRDANGSETTMPFDRTGDPKFDTRFFVDAHHGPHTALLTYPIRKLIRSFSVFQLGNDGHIELAGNFNADTMDNILAIADHLRTAKPAQASLANIADPSHTVQKAALQLIDKFQLCDSEIEIAVKPMLMHSPAPIRALAAKLLKHDDFSLHKDILAQRPLRAITVHAVTSQLKHSTAPGAGTLLKDLLYSLDLPSDCLVVVVEALAFRKDENMLEATRHAISICPDPWHESLLITLLHEQRDPKTLQFLMQWLNTDLYMGDAAIKAALAGIRDYGDISMVPSLNDLPPKLRHAYKMEITEAIAFIQARVGGSAEQGALSPASEETTNGMLSLTADNPQGGVSLIPENL